MIESHIWNYDFEGSSNVVDVYINYKVSQPEPFSKGTTTPVAQPDVRARESAARKVELSEADAGIVYATDAASDIRGQTGQLAIPDDLNVITTYPIAVVKSSPRIDLAQAFVDYVLSAEGQAVLTKYGFIPVR